MAASAAVPLVNNPLDIVKHTNSNKSHIPMKYTKELAETLNSAADAFALKSYKLAEKYFNRAIHLMSGKDAKIIDETLILTRYMVCACWLESSNAQDLLDCVKTLEDLEREYGGSYPMFYYALGRAYFQLYRFNKADEMLKKCFAIFPDYDQKFKEYRIPGKTDVIPESSRSGLLTVVANLYKQCGDWRLADAKCSFTNCSTIGHTEGADRNIFFGSPTFNGMVRVICNNPLNFCTMNFHTACWKAKKELYTVGRMSDKEVLNVPCFTPNCVNEKNERCTIKKIEIFDDNAKIKTTIPRFDDAVKHTKFVPPPKGAIKKQPLQSKVKVLPAETRPPSVRNPRPALVPKEEIPKVEETEEDDDLHDEQAFKSGMEKLRELRDKNFAVEGEEFWRPNFPMYGSEFMLAIAEALPDPEFSNDTPMDKKKKSFIFSYFYEFISNNGPMKIGSLEEKWEEVQSMITNCEYVLKNHVDITDFLLESLKFAIVGKYICTPDRLPEAYNLEKTKPCEILKFFLENDMDQQSSNSSIDDETIFNNILNQDNHNNASPYLSKPEDTKEIDKEDALTIIQMNREYVVTNEPNDSKSNVSWEQDILPIVKTESGTDVCECEISEIESASVKEKMPVVSSQAPLFTIGKFSAPIRKPNQKRSYSPELWRNNVLGKSTEKNLIKIPKESVPFGVPETDNQLRFITPNTFANYTKFNDHLETHADSLNDVPEISINNSGEPGKCFVMNNESIPPKLRTTENNEEKCETASSDNVVRLTAEVRELNVRLAASEEETERLKSELAQTKKAETTSRGRMLMKLLRAQYLSNQNVINSKLEMWRYTYDVISYIQWMLKNYTNQSLPINGSELLKTINEIEKIGQNHKEKFDEQMNAILQNEDLQDVELKPEDMPNFQKVNLIHIIQSGFDLYRNHHQNIPNLLALPCILPQPQPAYDSSFKNPPNPGLSYQPNINPLPLMQLTTTQQTFQGSMSRHVYNSQTPLQYVSSQNYKARENSFSSYPNVNNVVPSNFNPIGHQTSLSSHVYGMNKTTAAVQPNFSYPISGKIEKTAHSITEQGSSMLGQVTTNVRSSESEIIREQQRGFGPSWQKQNDTTIQSSNNLPMKCDVLQESKDRASNTSAAVQPNFSYRINGKIEKTAHSITEQGSSMLGQVTTNVRSSESEIIREQQRGFGPSWQNQNDTTIQSSNNLPMKCGVLQESKDRASNTSAAVQPNFPYPISGRKEKTAHSITEQGSSMLGQVTTNPRSSESEIIREQQRGFGPSWQKQNDTTIQSSNNLLMKFDVAQESKDRASTKPSVEENNVADFKHEASGVIGDIDEANGQSEINVRITENTYQKNDGSEFSVVKGDDKPQKEIESHKTTGHSMDKLMRRLRSHYTGVLELDLLKSVEGVRKKHNNSLSKLPMRRIICEADKFIRGNQRKQLCGYGKIPQNQSFAMLIPNSLCSFDDQRKRQNSTSSTSSVNSTNKDHQSTFASKKQWESITTPNEWWKQESPETDCSICFEAMVNPKQIRTLGCRHTFHKACVDPWIKQNVIGSCPMCRNKATTEDEYPPLC